MKENKKCRGWKKISYHGTSHTKLINDLTSEANLISTKGLTKDLRNKYNIINDSKDFFLDELQTYLLFKTFSSYFISENDKTGSWWSKGIPEESIKPQSTADNSFDSEII